jgi:CDP-diacylglycerol--glycerol-3-phosphate 3-phosphatidyltransferase
MVGEMTGVHHQKIALFDDTIIIGGANLSHSYFTNRRDRYIKMRECGQLADYFHDYIKVLSENGYCLKDKPIKVPNANLETHYKLWKFSYSPPEYKETLFEQEAALLKT